MARLTKKHGAVWTTGTDEVAAAQAAVNSAKRLVEQTRAVADKAATRLKQLKPRASETAARARQRKGTSAKRLADEMRRKLERARIEHQQTIARRKEASALLAEQKELTKLIERKQIARERAVATFLKRWNREYNRKLALIKKNASLRRKWLQRQ